MKQQPDLYIDGPVNYQLDGWERLTYSTFKYQINQRLQYNLQLAVHA